MGGQMHGAVAAGRARRPFPKPVREAVATLRENRVLGQWLEWRANERFVTRIELYLVTLREVRPSGRRLWATWQQDEAAGMQECLRKIGIIVQGGEHFLLNRQRAIESWYMP